MTPELYVLVGFILILIGAIIVGRNITKDNDKDAAIRKMFRQKAIIKDREPIRKVIEVTNGVASEGAETLGLIMREYNVKYFHPETGVEHNKKITAANLIGAKCNFIRQTKHPHECIVSVN